MLDVTGDGRLDRLELGRDGALVVSVNAGARRFDTIRQELPATPIADILVGDLDGDGRVDLYLVSTHENVALLGDGAGNFREATGPLGLSDGGVGVRAERVDLDDDGFADVLLHNATRDVVFWAVPGAGFTRSVDAPENDATITGQAGSGQGAAPGAGTAPGSLGGFGGPTDLVDDQRVGGTRGASGRGGIAPPPILPPSL